MGMLVANTASENIVYQSGFCSSGSINGVFTLQLDSSLRHNLLLNIYKPSLGSLWRRWNHRKKSDSAFRKIYDLQARSWWSNGCNSTVLDDMHGSYGEAASLSYCSTRGQFWWENMCVGDLLTLLLFHQQAHPCQIWQLVCTSDKKQRFATVATRSPSLFNRKQDANSKPLLISEESNHWIRQSLSRPWKGLTKPEIWIPCFKCATSGNCTMNTTVHGLHRFWSQNHASQILL